MSEKKYNENSTCKLGLSNREPDLLERYKGHKYANSYDVESFDDMLDFDLDIEADSISGTFFLALSGLVVTTLALFKLSLIFGLVGIILGLATSRKTKPIGIPIVCIGVIAVVSRILYAAPFISLLS